ncbi:hypothetical protein IEQ34_017939 [Dendrobium chrysotoxum]|uniref:Reticulon-like protein n=1 Tax=Dendrobium chrysotoxum TaxID=161865 RepID=A0AAV7FV66_DENCH|nr:hypothetical protein IEQ34_017939 [Dendrobium chrysotoxum]
MPLRFISSDSDSEEKPAVTAAAATTTTRLFGRQHNLHEVFGGGKVADVVLWRNKHLSAAILAGVSVIWFLLEVVEYNFLTLLCHISITGMLLLFIWSYGVALVDKSPPKLTEIILPENDFREFAQVLHARLSSFLSILQDVTMGKNLRLFFLAITSLWIISILGSSCSSLNLLYFGYLCIQILPVLYENYEGEVDHLVTKGSRYLRKLYRKFDSKVLNKIPRGPVKDKKHI